MSVHKVPAPAGDAAARWQLRLCGLPHAVSAQGQRHALERRDAALLALLAIDGPTPRNRALALLWPDDATEQVRGRLRQRLFTLKRKLGVDVVEGSQTLTLGSALVWPGFAQESVDAPLLGDDDHDDLPEFCAWLRAVRGRLQTQRREQLAEQAGELERAGRLAEAIVVAEQILALEPLQEHAHRRLMRLHYLRGDRAAALLAFDRCERLLKDDVGTTPSAETDALRRQIEAQSAPLPAPRALPVTLSRPPRLIGRADELRRIESVLAAGRSAIVIGEAGLGKSRLLAELHASRTRAMSVTARPGDADIPYALFARLVRRIDEDAGVETRLRPELARFVPELGVASTAPFDPGTFERAAEQLLAACPGPVLIDDLHFADAGSTALVARLAPLDGAPRFVIGTRPAEGTAGLALLDTALCDTQRAERIVLSPLARADIAGLVDSLGIDALDGARLAGLLERHTGGNPQFVLETLRAILTDGPRFDDAARLPLPPGVGALVERRLQQLSPAALRLARAAAVMDADFTPALAARALECSVLDLADPWRELEAASILNGAAFAHDIVHEATLRGIARPIAQHLHTTVALSLAEAGAEPARIARHWLAAGDLQRAAAPLTAAARQASAAHLHVDAARHYEQLADVQRLRGDGAAEFDAVRGWVDALIEVDVGARLTAAAARLGELARNDTQSAWAAHAEALRLLSVSDTAAALEASARALRHAQRAGDAQASFAARLARAQTLLKLRRLDEAEAVLAPARDWVEAPDSGAQSKDKLEALQVIAWLARERERFDESRVQWERCLEIAAARHSAAEMVTALNYIQLCDGGAGRFDRAVEAGERQRALMLEHGLLGNAAQYLDPNLAFVYLNTGRYAEALAAADRAEQAGLADIGLVYLRRTAIYRALGQTTRAQRELERARAVPPAAPLGRMNVLLMSCRVRHRGDAAQVSAWLDEIGAIARAQPTIAPRVRALLAHAECLDGEPALAAALEAARLASERGLHGLRIVAETRCAQARLAAGDPAAAGHARLALALLESYQPEGISAGEVGLVAYRALAAAGDETGARDALRAAVDWVHATAAGHVPAEFRDAFLNRHPVNRELLTLATRVLVAPAPRLRG